MGYVQELYISLYFSLHSEFSLNMDNLDCHISFAKVQAVSWNLNLLENPPIIHLVGSFKTSNRFK